MKNKKGCFVAAINMAMCMMLVSCANNDLANEDTVVENTPEVVENRIIGVSSLYGNEEINSAVFANICTMDDDGNLINEAGSITEEAVEDNKYLYTVSLNEGCLFSNAEPMTIDDVIAYYYICTDPSYTGESRIGELDIEGLDEYYFDTDDALAVIEGLEAYKSENLSQEDFEAYIKETYACGWYDGIDMQNGGPAGDNTLTWGEYCARAGLGTLDELSEINDDDEMLDMVAEAQWLTAKDTYDVYGYYKSKAAQDGINDGISVLEISGITRVDDYTCTVLTDSYNAMAKKWLSVIPVISKDYYCADFEKGSLEGFNEKILIPMVGSGEYAVSEYSDNKAELLANENYFGGVPNIKSLTFKVMDENDRLEAVLNGDIDSTTLSFSLETIEKLNENEAAVSWNVAGESVFGFIGINAERVSDVNIRKGLMSLMDRETAVTACYGEYASTVERPMIPTLPDYPENAIAYYEYNKDIALNCFEAAGYTQNDGVLINSDGFKLNITVGIAKDSTFPTADILRKLQADLSDMGAELIISEMEFDELNYQVQNGSLDMWAMAYGNYDSCDDSKLFGTYGDLNYFRYSNVDFDTIQSDIIKTKDTDRRRELVLEGLDIIMDDAVCMPVYQRVRIEAFKIQSN